MNALASSARFSELRQVGARSSRAARAWSRACFLRSEGLGGRVVRPRDWTTPAAVPRCLVRRLRLV